MIEQPGKQKKINPSGADLDPLPEKASILDGLDCEASLVPVLVTVELPFWLMVPDGKVEVTVEGVKFDVRIDESYVDLFSAEARDSRKTVLYNGPVPPKNSLIGQAAMSGASLMFRKAKTVLKIPAKCSSDALSAMAENSRRSFAVYSYFVTFCSAHLPVVNRLIEAYRWATADAMASVVTPRSVPVWWVRNAANGDGFHVHLLQEATWDYKPKEGSATGLNNSFAFTDLETLAAAASEIIEPSELALLDARSFLHQGDYSGAVRRTVTAVEVLLEHQLRVELTKHYGVDEIESRLLGTRNDFPGRLRQYQKLSTRILDDNMSKTLEKIRGLRHDIVHRGLVISHGDRAIAHKAVDIGRFIYNWIENDSASIQRREKRLAQKAIGGVDLDLFQSGISGDGVWVKSSKLEPPRDVVD